MAAYRISRDENGYWWSSREGAEWIPLPIPKGFTQRSAEMMVRENLPSNSNVKVVEWNQVKP